LSLNLAISAYMRTCHLLTALVCPVTLLASPLALPVKDGPRLKKRECSNPPKRVEWRNMQESDRQAYLNAEKCLFSQQGQTGLPGATNRNQDLAAVHQNMTDTIHGVGQFLPWHRYMLYAHEYLLRTECGYSGPMTWWDETKDAGNFANAPLFTSEYFGSAPTTNECITDGVCEPHDVSYTLYTN
jgi:Common central domain of tyrosinase